MSGLRTASSGRRSRWLAAVLTACGLGAPDAAAQSTAAPQPGRGRVATTKARDRPIATRAVSTSPTWSAVGALSIGRGLRFNNPYRLARPLGDTAESVSLAATYLDLGLALLSGERAVRHGPALGGGVALEGIGQFVLTPSYLAQFGIDETLGLRGRVGVPIVMAPDTTVGLEAGFASSLAFAYGLGALLELVGSVYFGAATDETSITTIPMLSLQVGVFFEHQVSP